MHGMALGLFGRVGHIGAADIKDASIKFASFQFCTRFLCLTAHDARQLNLQAPSCRLWIRRSLARGPARDWPLNHSCLISTHDNLSHIPHLTSSQPRIFAGFPRHNLSTTSTLNPTSFWRSATLSSMGDRVAASSAFYEEGAGDEPLVNGRTAQILDTDWVQRPLSTGSALIFAFDDGLLDPDGPDLAAEEWLSRTRDTWGLLSQWKLCDDCFAAGMGATRKSHLHQLSTAFPPGQDVKEDEKCDFCRLLRRISPHFAQEKAAQMSDELQLDPTWKLVLFMPSLRGPTSMALSLVFAPPSLDMDGTYTPDDGSWVVLQTFSIYVTFEVGEKSTLPLSFALSAGSTLKKSKIRLYTSRTRVSPLTRGSKFPPCKSRCLLLRPRSCRLSPGRRTAQRMAE